VVSSLSEEEAHNALRSTIPDFKRYLAEHRLEIVLDSEWYMNHGAVDLERVFKGWREKETLDIVERLFRNQSGVGYVLAETGSVARLQ
jgi:hypothetical protein